jgi:hypothetical protein
MVAMLLLDFELVLYTWLGPTASPKPLLYMTMTRDLAHICKGISGFWLLRVSTLLPSNFPIHKTTTSLIRRHVLLWFGQPKWFRNFMFRNICLWLTSKPLKPDSVTCLIHCHLSLWIGWPIFILCFVLCWFWALPPLQCDLRLRPWAQSSKVFGTSYFRELGRFFLSNLWFMK